MVLVHFLYFLTSPIPCELDVFAVSMPPQFITQHIALHDRSYLVGHFIYVPEVDFQAVAQYFTDAGLAADQCRRTITNSLKGGQAEWFGYRRHNKEITDGVGITPVLASLKICKQNLIANTEISGLGNQLVILLAAADDKK